MSQVQKRRIGFLLAPIVTITACMIAFMYYSGVEAAPPNAGPSMGDDTPSLQVGGFSRPAEEGGTIPRPTQYTYAMQIGPIAGLTTAWHEAPPLTAIPRGTVLEFRKAGLSMAQITWTGAQEVRREGDDSIAECFLQELGTSVVTVNVTRPGGYQREHRCELYVVDTPVEAITLAPLEVSVAPLPVDENSSNQTTMQYFFARDSIAQFTPIGPAHYRTSIDKRITFRAQTVPTGFEPLMEWRRNGSIIGLGAALEDYVIVSPGSNVFVVGPTAAPEQIQIDAYGVTITSHVTGQNSIPESEPVTLTAVTDPPGYEDDITWLSTTKYGTGTPILGTGPTFTVQFDDTFGPDPEGGLWQWLGVRADNARVGQDQKAILIEQCPDEVCGAPPAGDWCHYRVAAIAVPSPCNPAFGPFVKFCVRPCPLPGQGRANCPNLVTFIVPARPGCSFTAQRVGGDNCIDCPEEGTASRWEVIE